jgi:hypothetical protein
MAAKANIVIDQGADFSTTITVTDNAGAVVDLTGYTGRGQIRKHYTSETAVDFDVSFGTPKSDGKVTLSLTNAQTTNMEPGRYVYDAEIITGGGVVSRLVEGLATVTPEVTRSS